MCYVHWNSHRDLLTLAQSIKCLPSLAELIEGASLNSYFVAASQIPTTAVQWANKVEVSTDVLFNNDFYG